MSDFFNYDSSDDEDYYSFLYDDDSDDDDDDNEDKEYVNPYEDDGPGVLGTIIGGAAIIGLGALLVKGLFSDSGGGQIESSYDDDDDDDDDYDTCSDTVPFTCPHCRKTFRVRSGLNEYQCNFCGKRIHVYDSDDSRDEKMNTYEGAYEEGNYREVVVESSSVQEKKSNNTALIVVLLCIGGFVLFMSFILPILLMLLF